MDFNIILLDLNNELKINYNKYLANLDNFSYFIGYLNEYADKFDCIVSPANSFGLMDGFNLL
jgi:hypothetical protein